MTKPEDEEPRVDRALLDDWAPPEPADGFVDRAMARIDTSARPARSLRAAGFGFVAGLAVAAAVALFVTRAGGDVTVPAAPSAVAEPRSGTLDAAGRTTEKLGDRVTAVAEQGARLFWKSAGGATAVDHREGYVFYRIDPGAEEVRFTTPLGDIVVTGTCIALDVSATRTELSVFEGRVEVVQSGSRTTVVAGDRVRLTRRGLSRPAKAPSEQQVDTPSPPPEPCACVEDVSRLDPGPKVLARWADECRVRTDMPPLGFDDKQLDGWLLEMDLDADESGVVRDALRTVEGRADDELVRFYAEATGRAATIQEVPILMMYDQVIQSAEINEPAEVRRRIARERAGLDTAPAADAQSPYERQIRIMAGLGDKLEEELATRLGAPRASALRQAHDGWPGRGFDDAGCP